jgi:prepilin-type N-terminal cleavage/methylation domain-containing protein
MLNTNKKLSKNGFSLIELMVAVVILAMVSFGIFQAFTTAFQTLNDAKDRTIATNYAQQILEDYKNTHFEKIIAFSAPIEGTKFTQNVSKDDVNENLKNVIVQINWLDRNNNTKNINISTLIYNTQITAVADSTPAGISIYATPYNLLPGTDEDAEPSEITAEIVDENGDLITDWDESNVDFEIVEAVDFDNNSYNEPSFSEIGTLSSTLGTPISQGVAKTTFSQYTEEENEGYVKIKASLTIDGVEIYDTLILKITNDAVAVVLTSDKEIISTEGGEEGTAHLTATIVDAIGRTVITDREIYFSIISGPGTLTNFESAVEGVAFRDLMAGTTTGVSTIMATSNLLEPGSVSIEIVDPGIHEINVMATDQTIVQQGETTITAYLTNFLGDGISGEVIQLSTDNGTLTPTSGTTNGDGSITATLTMNYAGTAIVTASWTAEDSSVISDTVEVVCRNHSLYVSADPPTITEGSSTTISAELTNADGHYVASEIINFTITGNGSLSSNSATTDENGIASVTLTIDSQGTTIVEGNWSGDPTVVTDDKEVECISAPTYEIELAGSTTISVGDTPTITATVTQGGNPVGSGITVRFSSDDYTNARLDGSSSYVDKTTDGVGLAFVVLSGLTAGEDVVVTATETIGSASDSMTITCEAPAISITLADPSNIEHPEYWWRGQWNTSYEKISFDIIITDGDVALDKMIVSWTPDSGEELERVYIDDNELYRNNQGADNGTLISFNRGNDKYDLEDDNEYTFEMWFDSNVIDKSWTITFIDPDTEEVISTITFDLD